MSRLAEKKCEPCRGGTPPLDANLRGEFLAQLEGWKVVDDHHLQKYYSFSDFLSALSWVNRIAEIAEREGHHPDLELGWGYVNVKIWTHKIDNLTESDFVLAAKLDEEISAAKVQ